MEWHDFFLEATAAGLVFNKLFFPNASSFVGTLLGFGLALGTGIFAYLQVALGSADFLAYGWRIAFLLSLVLVAVGIVVRCPS